jgi:mannitol-1-phosphate/altronate dehydrogenase
LGALPRDDAERGAGGDRAAAYAVRSLADAVAFLGLAEVFPPLLRDNERFREAFASATRSLAMLGPLDAVEKLG